MTNLGHNGGPPLDPRDRDLAIMFARFHINDILKTLLEMRSLEHRGYFMTALMVMYDRGGYLPADDDMAARVMALDVRVYKRLKAIMVAAEKFRETELGVTNDRVVREIAEFCRQQQRRRDAAQKREDRKRELYRTSERIPGEFSENSPKSLGDLVQQVDTTSSHIRPENVNENNGCTATAVHAAPPQLSGTRARYLSLSHKEVGSTVSRGSAPRRANLVSKPLSETAVSDDDVGCAPRTRKPVGYSAAFEAFWRQYPETTGMSKRRAWMRWQALGPEEREQAVAALPAWQAQIAARRKRMPDSVVLHAEGYLHQRRFETLMLAPVKPAGPWWADPARVAQVSPERWLQGIREHANGTWPVDKLGPPPGHPACVVPAEIAEAMRLADVYDPHGIQRPGAVLQWAPAAETH